MDEKSWFGNGWSPPAFWEHVESNARWTPRTLRLLVASFWTWFARQQWDYDWNGLVERAEIYQEWAETGKFPHPHALRQGILFDPLDTSPRDAVTRLLEAPGPSWGRGWDSSFVALIDIIRDILGNPFRPVAFDPAWRTEAVVALAAGVYADRAFGRLPVLADALEDAGCANPDVLGHCRSPGPHARGCWVVDLVLGKA